MVKKDNAPKRHQTKRQLTSNKEEWLKAVSNLKQRIKNLERQGAIVDFKIPEMPKRVTKQMIKALNRIRRPQLVVGAKYTSPTDKKEIKYKPAQQLNEEGKLEKWKAPERGKVKEREQEVRARKIAQDIIELAKDIGALAIPDISTEPKSTEIAPPEPETDNQPREYPEDSSFDTSWYDEDEYWDSDYWDEAVRDNQEEQLRLADAQIENLRESIADLGDDDVIERLNNILDNVINMNGKEETADRIEANLGKIGEYSVLAAKYKGTAKGNGFVNMIAQLIAGDRVLSFGELAQLERANDYNDDFSAPK